MYWQAYGEIHEKGALKTEKSKMLNPPFRMNFNFFLGSKSLSKI